MILKNWICENLFKNLNVLSNFTYGRLLIGKPSRGALREGFLGALGRPRGAPGTLLGRSWGALGALLGALGRSWSALGMLLGRSWGALGCSWGTWGALGALWGGLGALRGLFWHALGGLLGCSWGALGTSWGHLGAPKTQVIY